MKKSYSDIVIAIATPPGVGAIGVIRLSGKGSIELVDKYFFGQNLEKAAGNTVHYGKIKNDQNAIIDECLATVFRSPKSYTKEDVIELSCHGSPYILKSIVELFLNAGARMADPGEFTLRAFLNGQFDLSQAEGVADLIASENAASHELAMSQMRGGFSNEIKSLRQELIDFAALIELELDFGEEDVEFANRDDLKSLIFKLQKTIKGLADSFVLGNVIKSGVATVIAGRPNAGKSTLLNALLNEERAIVSEIAGTTRDTIEEVLHIRGIAFRLIDTAGIRKAQDAIEEIGVEKTIEKISQSTLVVYVFDVTETQPEALWSDIQTFLQASKAITASGKLLFVANKMDLNPYTKPESYYKDGLISKENLVATSAVNKMNIEALKDMVYNLIIDNPQLLDQTIVTNARHVDALRKSREALDAVLGGLNANVTGDFISMDIRQALHHLGEITGEIHTDDLLESIFSRFCIGK